MFVFLTLSLSLTPAIVLRHRISNTSSLSLSIFRSVQDSEPYVAIGKIRALYIRTLIDREMFWLDQILSLSLPKAQAARLIRLCTSSPTAGTMLPRKVNLSTVSIASPFMVIFFLSLDITLHFDVLIFMPHLLQACCSLSVAVWRGLY